MRQALSQRNVAKLARKLDMPVVAVVVRGNTGHRKDVILANAEVYSLWPDGTLTPQGKSYGNRVME